MGLSKYGNLLTAFAKLHWLHFTLMCLFLIAMQCVTRRLQLEDLT